MNKESNHIYKSICHKTYVIQLVCAIFPILEWNVFIISVYSNIYSKQLKTRHLLSKVQTSVNRPTRYKYQLILSKWPNIDWSIISLHTFTIFKFQPFKFTMKVNGDPNCQAPNMWLVCYLLRHPTEVIKWTKTLSVSNLSVLSELFFKLVWVCSEFRLALARNPFLSLLAVH